MGIQKAGLKRGNSTRHFWERGKPKKFTALTKCIICTILELL